MLTDSAWSCASLNLRRLESFSRFESFLDDGRTLIVRDLLFFFVRVENWINSSPQKLLLKLLAFRAHFPSELFLLLSDHLNVLIFFVFAARGEGFIEAELVLQLLIMTAHDIVHLADVLRSFLLLIDSVFF